MAVPCGKTKFFSTGAIKAYALPSRKRLIHHWNPPPKVNFVPNTLYSAKMRKKMPTAMRRAASARALRSFAEEAEEGVSIRGSPQAEVPAAAAVLRGQAYTSEVA